MAESADAADLKSASAKQSTGSSPVPGTIFLPKWAKKHEAVLVAAQPKGRRRKALLHIFTQRSCSSLKRRTLFILFALLKIAIKSLAKVGKNLGHVVKIGVAVA